MFLEFINFLTQFDSGFNVLQYLTLRAILAMLMSLPWIVSCQCCQPTNLDCFLSVLPTYQPGLFLVSVANLPTWIVSCQSYQPTNLDCFLSVLPTDQPGLFLFSLTNLPTWIVSCQSDQPTNLDCFLSVMQGRIQGGRTRRAPP